MKTFCPNCHKENDIKVYEYNEFEAEVWSDEVTVPVYFICPNCNCRLTGVAYYAYSHLGEVELDDD